MCASFFNNTLTHGELSTAINLRIEGKDLIPFDGDSFDRELVRDICLRLRGSDTTEHDVNQFLALRG